MGVAGLHRVLAVLEKIRAADVVIVVAGMDGALPSVVAGLVEAPVVRPPLCVFPPFSLPLPPLSRCSACRCARQEASAEA